MDLNNFANINNPEELQEYIKSKVQSELKTEKEKLIQEKIELSLRLKKVEASERKLEDKAAEFNKKIKSEIDRQERLISEKKRELDRRFLENEKMMEKKFADREKILSSKESEVNNKALTAERKVNAELLQRERELERKIIQEERKIPGIVKKAQDEAKIQLKLVEQEKRSLDRKINEIQRKLKEIKRRENDLDRRDGAKSESALDENHFKKDRVKREEDDSNAWLTTYSDVITLLLTMFVFLFTISKFDYQKLEEVQEALQVGLLQKSNQNNITEPVKKETVFEKIKKQMQIILAENNISENVEVTITDDGVMIELASSTLYDLGSANIKKEIEPVLDEVIGLIINITDEEIVIEVEGHTDNIPINTLQFPSNWELSANRATNIVKYFISKGIDPLKLKPVGFADSRPKVPNLDSEGNPIPENQSKNRRVEIYIEKATH